MSTKPRGSRRELNYDPDAAYMLSWASTSPRPTRKCAARRKYYIDSDSDPDNDDDDMVAVNKRATTLHNAIQGITLGAGIHSNQRTVPPVQIATQEHSNSRLFKSLPVEIHQKIVDYLPKDRDVTRYAQICRSTSVSITSSVWRKRFARTFDTPEDMSSQQLAREYMTIRGISRKWCCFDEVKLRGSVTWQLMEEQKNNKPLCLQMLKGLIINSNARKELNKDGNECVIGLNHDYIRKLVTQDAEQNSKNEVQFIDIIDAILKTDVNAFSEKILSAEDEYLVQVIQLCLTPLNLHQKYGTRFHHFDLSQEMAYANPFKQPVFLGEWKQRLNIYWLLATINFFKLHLQHNGEGLLAGEYLDLEPGQSPQTWLGKLKDETQELGTYWKGAYTFMEQRDLVSFRRACSGRNGNPTVFVDDFEPLQDISIFFNESKFPSKKWPRSFEKLNQTDPYVEIPYSSLQPRNLRSRKSQITEAENRRYPFKSFYGTARGEKLAHFYGRIHALPPQGGIPGFQRVSLIKFWEHDGEFDPNMMWAYEGCVLPGNRIIVGRWSWITDTQIQDDDIFSGPFIFWNVDDSRADPPIEETESLDFLESLKDLKIGI